jgi:hypothetical protein
MTTVDEIMAEAIKKADAGYSPTRLRVQWDEDSSISPNAPGSDAPESAGIRLTPEQLRARRARSIAIALALGAFVLVVIAVTMVRLGSGALNLSDDYMRPVQTIK